MAKRKSGAVSVARSEPRTRTSLLLESIALRHQIAVLERCRTRRPCFRRFDRLFWILLSRWWLDCRGSLVILSEHFGGGRLMRFGVKVPQGYQWWHIAYDAEADARVAITKAFPEAQIVEAKRAGNVYHVKDGASYQLPNTRPPIRPFVL